MARPKQISDRALLDAARAVFLRQGIQAPVSAVARELGVSVGALFFRMKSKEHLLLRALMPPFPPPEVALLEQEPLPQDRPLERLLRLLTGLCNFLPEAVPAFFLLHTAGVLPMEKDKPDTIDVVMRKALAAWLRRAQTRRLIAPGNTYAAADAIIGALEARFMHAYLLKQPHSAAQNRSYLKRLLAVVLPGPKQPVRRRG